jgi:hypothetical protein
MPGDEVKLKVRVCLNNLSNGKIQITCLKPLLGGAGHARPYDSEADVKKVLLAFGIAEDEVDAFLAALHGLVAMNLLRLGEYDISDEVLAATGFTAV